MPALSLDVALIHMNRADARGNGQFLGPDPYFDDLFCMAAKRRFMSCEQDRRDARLREVRLGPHAEDQPHDGRRRDRDAGRRALHRVPARLRPRRGLPARVRRDREEPRGVGRVPQALPRRRERGRVPASGARLAGSREAVAADDRSTRAEICAVAMAEAFRGDGEILVSLLRHDPGDRRAAREAHLRARPADHRRRRAPARQPCSRSRAGEGAIPSSRAGCRSAASSTCSGTAAATW